MTDHIDAYRAQIEAAGLPITGVESDDGWTTIEFKYEFVFVVLTTPDDTPSYCRLFAGFSLGQVAEEDRPGLIARANENSEMKRIAKTTVGFSDDGAVVRYACEFFSDAEVGYSIKPSLTQYLNLLGGAAATFNRQPTEDASDDEPESD